VRGNVGFVKAVVATLHAHAMNEDVPLAFCGLTVEERSEGSRALSGLIWLALSGLLLGWWRTMRQMLR